MKTECFAQISSYLESQKEEMVKTLEQIVNLESFSREPVAIEQTAKAIKTLFEAEGLECKLLPAPPNGPTLIGILGAKRKGVPILFSGHMDTVIKPGIYPKPVFRTEGGKAFGPGVLDMKGGIVIALYTIKALNSIGYCERPIKIAFSGDEEICHKDSRGNELLIEAARGACCALNMETGLPDNSLCYGRKGRVETHITVHGRGSHAGNDFLHGINAISEMAEKIIRIQKLTDLEKETTVTCSVIHGGTVSNAVPAECSMDVECRFVKTEEMQRFQKGLQEICDTSYIGDTTTETVFSSVIPPYECNEDAMRLWRFIKKTAEEYGLAEVKGKTLGGGSDAAYIQTVGVPVVCSMGIQGEWNHTTKEYALLDSLVSRCQLSAAIILELAHFEKEEAV